MRVAQLTTTLRGGAGEAATRLSGALNEVGIVSELISQRSATGETSARSKFTTVLQKHFVQSSPNLITTYSQTTIQEESLESYNILHFHSIYNLIKVQDIGVFARGRPIFLTLHDQRLLTGGCHYSGPCKGFESACQECPQTKKTFRGAVHRQKMLLDVLLNDARVHVISPSVWLAKMAETIIASKKKVHVIRNPIPRVENLNKLMSKETYDINPKKFVIGFVSMQLDNPLKGLRDLGNAIKLLPTEILDRLHLLLIGKSKLFLDEERITQSFIKDPTGTIGLKIYQLMDVLVVPSRQDNSPNVIGEALMNGTPIIGSKVGGIPELMREFNCQVVNTTDAQSLANAIIEQTTRDYSRSYLARRAEMVFGYTVIGSELKNLYESSL